MRGGPCENESGLSFKTRGSKVVKGGELSKGWQSVKERDFVFLEKGSQKEEAFFSRESHKETEGEVFFRGLQKERGKEWVW